MEYLLRLLPKMGISFWDISITNIFNNGVLLKMKGKLFLIDTENNVFSNITKFNDCALLYDQYIFFLDENNNLSSPYNFNGNLIKVKIIKNKKMFLYKKHDDSYHFEYNDINVCLTNEMASIVKQNFERITTSDFDEIMISHNDRKHSLKLLFSHCYIYNNEFYCDGKMIEDSIATTINKENFEFIRKGNNDTYFKINNIVYKNNIPILTIDMDSFINMAKNKFNVTENFIGNPYFEFIFNEYILIGISTYTYSSERIVTDGYTNTVVGRDSKTEWGYRKPISHHTTMETNVNIHIYYISISSGEIQRKTIFSFDFKDCPWFGYSVTRLLFRKNNRENELINSKELKNDINNMKLDCKEFIPTLNINSTENFECSIYKINMLLFKVIRAKITNRSKNISYSKKIKEYKIFYINNLKYILINECVPYYSNGVNLSIYRYVENIHR